MTIVFRHAGLSLTVSCVLAFGILHAEDSAKPSRRFTPFVLTVERVCQSTVDIHTEKQQKSLDVVFPTSKPSKINGMGTGIVIDERGYIVTNHHVVEGVDRLSVTLADGTTFDAVVFKSDPQHDLAIIKIDAPKPLPVMPLGTSSDLKLCEQVIAVGNAFGYNHTVTQGIISALGRDVEVNDEQGYENLIQTDAAINPGNSGGPLLNADGEVIGINVAIRQGAQKIGFAIPIDDARRVIADLMSVERNGHMYHGLEGRDVKNGQECKFVVRAVEPNSPAAAAGLKPGDVVVRSRNIDVIDAADLERSLFGATPGQQVPLIIERDGEEQNLTLELAVLPTERYLPGPSSVARSQTIATQRITTAAVAAGNAWRVLGLKLTPVNGSETALKGQPFSGGMRVLEVRAQSPAEQNGIRAGDILVGLHIWETVSEENINYVLNHPQLSTLTPLKFYILRNGETLFGHFQSVIARR